MISDLYYPDILGGTETNLQTISESLTINNDITVICTRQGNEGDSIEELNGVKVYRIDTGNIYSIFDCTNKPFLLKFIWHLRSLRSWQSYFSVKKILKKERPDIVHTHNLQSLSPLIFDAIKELDIPNIHELHDYGLLCPRTSLLHRSGKLCINPNIMCKLYRNLKRLMLDDKPQIVIGPSEFVIEKHLEHGFFEKTNHQKLPHGTEISDTTLKKDYALIDILYVGQLSKHKGVHILIEAFKQVKRPDLRLHICGRGKSEGEYRKLAEGDNRIRFHGYVPDEDLNLLYDKANILVVPSIWYDNSPTVIYEAFVHCTPVVGSRIGGITELINDGENGLLFQPGNINELTEKLWRLKSSKLEYFVRNLRKNNEKYSITSYLKELLSLYRDLRI